MPRAAVLQHGGHLTKAGRAPPGGGGGGGTSCGRPEETPVGLGDEEAFLLPPRQDPPVGRDEEGGASRVRAARQEEVGLVLRRPGPGEDLQKPGVLPGPGRPHEKPLRPLQGVGPEELGEVQVVAEGKPEGPALPREEEGPFPGAEALVPLFPLRPVEVELGVGGALGEGLQAVFSFREVPREEEKPRLFRKLPKGLGKPGVLPFAQDELGEEQKPRPRSRASWARGRRAWRSSLRLSRLARWARARRITSGPGSARRWGRGGRRGPPSPGPRG